jgi:Putative lumazine-binding
MTHSDYDAVIPVLQTYFDGLYYSDTGRLGQVFHPKAQYVSVTEGALLYRDMAEYFPVVDARPSPASRGEPRRDEIVSVEFTGLVTARWQITSKVFDFYQEA